MLVVSVCLALMNESGMQCTSCIANDVQIKCTDMRPVEPSDAGQGGHAAHVAHGEREERSAWSWRSDGYGGHASVSGYRQRSQLQAVPRGNLQLATLTLNALP